MSSASPRKENQLSRSYTQAKGGIAQSRVINKDYLETLGDFSKCNICFNIMLNPTDCEACGHSYCYDCISRLKCPFGCEEKKLKPSSIGIKSLLNNLIFKCENEGCNAEISYANVVSHDQSCEYQKITCPNEGCNLILCRKDLENHIKDECKYTLIPCQYCKHEFTRIKIEDHEKVCHGVYNALNGDGNFDEALNASNVNGGGIDTKKYLEALSLNISKIVKDKNIASNNSGGGNLLNTSKLKEEIENEVYNQVERRVKSMNTSNGNELTSSVGANVINGNDEELQKNIGVEIEKKLKESMTNVEKNIDFLSNNVTEVKTLMSKIKADESDGKDKELKTYMDGLIKSTETNIKDSLAKLNEEISEKIKLKKASEKGESDLKDTENMLEKILKVVTEINEKVEKYAQEINQGLQDIKGQVSEQSESKINVTETIEEDLQKLKAPSQVAQEKNGKSVQEQKNVEQKETEREKKLIEIVTNTINECFTNNKEASQLLIQNMIKEKEAQFFIKEKFAKKNYKVKDLSDEEAESEEEHTPKDIKVKRKKKTKKRISAERPEPPTEEKKKVEKHYSDFSSEKDNDVIQEEKSIQDEEESEGDEKAEKSLEKEKTSEEACEKKSDVSEEDTNKENKELESKEKSVEKTQKVQKKNAVQTSKSEVEDKGPSESKVNASEGLSRKKPKEGEKEDSIASSGEINLTMSEISPDKDNEKNCQNSSQRITLDPSKPLIQKEEKLDLLSSKITVDQKGAESTPSKNEEKKEIEEKKEQLEKERLEIQKVKEKLQLYETTLKIQKEYTETTSREMIGKQLEENAAKIQAAMSSKFTPQISNLSSNLDDMSTQINILQESLQEIKGIMAEEFSDITSLVKQEKPTTKESILIESHQTDFTIERATSQSPVHSRNQTELLQKKRTLTIEEISSSIADDKKENTSRTDTDQNQQDEINKNKDDSLIVKNEKIDILSLFSQLENEMTNKIAALEAKMETSLDARFKSMFSLRCCLECEKVDYFYGFLKCSICQRESCKQCVVLCTNCKHIVCKQCALCPGCQKPYCLNCRTQCSTCSKKFCSTCISQCTICHKPLCILCIKQCMSCKKQICENCSKTCKICEKHSCYKCETIKNFQQCNNCSNIACGGCISQCSFCSLLYCSKCFVSCNDCDSKVCLKCAHKCGGCSDQFCPSCAKAFKQSRCEMCNKDFCTNCMKNLRKCKLCNKIFCSNCCSVCDKCGFLYCHSCAVECDNCCRYMCNKCAYYCTCDLVLFCFKCFNGSEPIGPHDCVLFMNDSTNFVGTKSRSKMKVKYDFEAKFYLEAYVDEPNLLIGITDNNRFDEDSVSFVDNIWTFKARTGEKYSSEKSIQPYYKLKRKVQEGDIINVAVKNENLFFKVNDDDTSAAFTINTKNDYWIYIENDAPNSKIKVRFVYMRKI